MAACPQTMPMLKSRSLVIPLLKVGDEGRMASVPSSFYIYLICSMHQYEGGGGKVLQNKSHSTHGKWGQG